MVVDFIEMWYYLEVRVRLGMVRYVMAWILEERR